MIFFTYQTAPFPLVGRYLLCKLHAQITFALEKQQLCVEVLLEHALQFKAFLTFPEGSGNELFPPKIYDQVSQAVWVNRTPAVNIQLVKINLKEWAWIPWKEQYPLKKKSLEGIQPVL